MPEDNPVTIIQFDNSMEANLVKTLLEDNGIMCFLADENLASVNPLYSDAIGRIKLQVPEKQRDKAAEILKENNYDFKSYEKGDNIKVAPCSKCNSRKVYPEKFSIGFIIFSSLFLFIPMILKKRYWRCRDCQYQWLEPVTGNRIFLSVLIIPFLVIMWALIIMNVKEYYNEYDYQVIDEHKGEISKLEMIEQIGNEKHGRLIEKITQIYLEKGDAASAIAFMVNQNDLLLRHKKNNSIPYYLIKMKMEIIPYEHKMKNTYSKVIVNECLKNLKQMEYHDCNSYNKYIDTQKFENNYGL